MTWEKPHAYTYRSVHFQGFYPLPPTHRPQGSMIEDIKSMSGHVNDHACACVSISLLCPQQQNGVEVFDLVGHSGHEFNIIPAKHLAQHLSSGRCTELVEVEDVQIWETPQPHLCLQSGVWAPTSLRASVWRVLLVIQGHPEMEGDIHRRKGARSLCGWKKVFLAS